MIIRLQDFQAKKHRRCPERIIKSRIYIYFGKKKRKWWGRSKLPPEKKWGCSSSELSHWIPIFISLGLLLSCFKFVIGESRGLWWGHPARPYQQQQLLPTSAPASESLLTPYYYRRCRSKEGRAVVSEGHGRHRFQKKAPSAAHHTDCM